MVEKQSGPDAFDWAYNEFIKNDTESSALFKEYEVKGDIAQHVYDLRKEAGLSQEELAGLIGVAESVVQDLEEADYEGDSVAMLVRIASAVNKKIEIRFVPAASIESSDLTG